MKLSLKKKQVQVTHLSCNFDQLVFTQSCDIAKNLFFGHAEL